METAAEDGGESGVNNFERRGAYSRRVFSFIILSIF
jgi:hypothetical protein